MDLSTLIGLIVGIGGILLGNILEGGHVGSLVQGAAFVIVMTGTFGAVLVSSRRKDIKLGFSMLKKAFADEDIRRPAEKNLAEIIECAKLAKKESILAIESRLKSIDDPFLRNVMQGVVDGVDTNVFRSVFDKQVELEEEKLMAGAKVWADAGGFSPTIGIIGAVLGLIHVMGNLADVSKLGAGIAVAFVATVYGVGFANLVFLPLANKLKKKIATEIKIKEMMIEGGLCILSGLSPSLTELKLRAFIEKES